MSAPTTAVKPPASAVPPARGVPGSSEGNGTPEPTSRTDVRLMVRISVSSPESRRAAGCPDQEPWPWPPRSPASAGPLSLRFHDPEDFTVWPDWGVQGVAIMRKNFRERARVMWGTGANWEEAVRTLRGAGVTAAWARRGARAPGSGGEPRRLDQAGSQGAWIRCSISSPNGRSPSIGPMIAASQFSSARHPGGGGRPESAAA
jgi:hypothetical protein